MSANPQTGSVDYLTTLCFWKAVEEKYHQRKRQWMEAKARMITAKLASIRARKEMEQVTRDGDVIPDCGQGEAPESDYDDCDDEFSDVEQDMFLDPADRYYSISGDRLENEQPTAKSLINQHVLCWLIWLFAGGRGFSYSVPALKGSLDADSWNQIRDDIMREHERKYESKKKFISKVLLMILILFWLLVAGLYCIYQARIRATIDATTQRQTACIFGCDQKSVMDEIIQIVYPKINIDEEI